ncbi:hypothetical protein AB4Y45_33020 [Paraburkholderia sp. EG287A]|uniref:hypothetical protein n=1 Tax=Paraburkholderia sp. EG287A TaxID=3237012 RepID=UPI0034D1F1E0
MNVTSVEPFRTRAVGQDDFTKGLRYTGAAGGVIWPGDLAEKVLGPEINFGVLFAYCFRRFGFPNMGGDDLKDIAIYSLTTPMPGVFLRVRISPTNASRLMFGYMLPWDLQREMLDEERATNLEFHKQFSAWRKNTGLLLPRDGVEVDGKVDYDTNEDMQLFTALLEQYCAAGGTHYDAMPAGPKTQAVLDALCATMEDLKSPVDVRDQAFSAVDDYNVEFEYSAPEELEGPDAEPVEAAGGQGENGDEDEEDDDESERNIVRAHASAGYFVPPAYMADPKRFVRLSEKLIELGAGDLSRGIDTFISKDAATS